MPTTVTPNEIQLEFDEIASMMPADDRLGPYEDWLLRNLPARRASVLELGCGIGSLARQLASRFTTVEAVDFSPGMIREAVRRTPRDLNVRFVTSDLFSWLAASRSRYDCVVSVGTLHHVDLAVALRAMAPALNDGGRIIVIDIEDRSTWRDLIPNLLAWLVARGRDLRAGDPATLWKLTQAYRRHGRHEKYLRHAEVVTIAQQELPGALVRQHLLWRYSLIWDKPGSR